MVSGMLVLVVNSKMGLAMVVELIEMFCGVHLLVCECLYFGIILVMYTKGFMLLIDILKPFSAPNPVCSGLFSFKGLMNDFFPMEWVGENRFPEKGRNVLRWKGLPPSRISNK